MNRETNQGRNGEVVMRSQMSQPIGESTGRAQPSGVQKSIVAVSLAMQAAVSAARSAAGRDDTVFVYGEAGSGKRLLARLMHEQSPRRSQPCVVVQCAQLNTESIKSTLYGDLTTGRVGRLEEAGEGTVILAGIEDLNPLAQEHIMSLMRTRRYTTSFGETRAASFRIMATGDKAQLEELTASGVMSADLVHDLAAVSICMPSLSDRTEDIPGLSMYILDEMAEREKITRPTIPYHYMELLMKVSWSENVRQLRNHLESVMVLSNGQFDPQIIREHFVEEQAPATIAGVAQSLWQRIRATLGDVAPAANRVK